MSDEDSPREIALEYPDHVKEAAKQLYITLNKPADIAHKLGIDKKIIYEWSKHPDWKYAQRKLLRETFGPELKDNLERMRTALNLFNAKIEESALDLMSSDKKLTITEMKDLSQISSNLQKNVFTEEGKPTNVTEHRVTKLEVLQWLKDDPMGEFHQVLPDAPLEIEDGSSSD